MVSGIPAIDGELVGKEWWVQAVSDVQKVLRDLIRKELPIILAQNSTKRYQGAEITYIVRMSKISDSQAIRQKFGSLFVGGTGDRHPECLKGTLIKNRVTPETLTRISIFKQLTKRFIKDLSPGSRV